MTALYDCSLIFRSILSLAALLCIVLSCSMIVFGFIQKKKVFFSVNAVSFALEFFVLLILNTAAEYKIGNDLSPTLVDITQKPASIFALLTVAGVLITTLSLIKEKDSIVRIRKSRGNPDGDYLLCRRAEQLQKDNTRLAEMNKQMKLYGEEMQAQIKQKEILQAKTQIHNGMNRLLMISSRAMESGDKTEIEKAMSLWHRDALLLCREAVNEESSDIMHDIEALAESLHIKLICKSLPAFPDEKTAILFQKLACEAMLNAVKHADADVFEISVMQDGFVFSNNGELPKGEIRFGGGLTEIKYLAENAGYDMTIRCDEHFSLIFSVPQKKEV